jgi:hypothetical protein
LDPISITLQNGLNATICDLENSTMQRLSQRILPLLPTWARGEMYVATVQLGSKVLQFVFISSDPAGLIALLRVSLRSELEMADLIIYQNNIYPSFTIKTDTHGIVYRTPSAQAETFINAVMMNTQPEILALVGNSTEEKA